MFQDLRDSLSKLCFWRLPTAEATVTRMEVDQASGQILIHYRFFVGDDGPFTGMHMAEGMPLLGVKELNVGQAITVRYRRDNPSVNMPDRDRSLTPDL